MSESSRLSSVPCSSIHGSLMWHHLMPIYWLRLSRPIPLSVSLIRTFPSSLLFGVTTLWMDDIMLNGIMCFGSDPNGALFLFCLPLSNFPLIGFLLICLASSLLLLLWRPTFHQVPLLYFQPPLKNNLLWTYEDYFCESQTLEFASSYVFATQGNCSKPSVI